MADFKIFNDFLVWAEENYDSTIQDHHFLNWVQPDAKQKADIKETALRSMWETYNNRIF